ncbi:helix-turn-helix transcriptional regulator [Leptospira yasudae]|nr:helix-turn-helix transcriptional regulator [Leptospira yasudae]
MSIRFLQPKSFYYYCFYFFAVFLWMIFEAIEFFTEPELSRIIAVYVDYYEVLIGFLTFGGLYYVYKQSTAVSLEISESKELIKSLNRKNSLSASSREEFWKGIKNQFSIWKYTQTEEEIAIYILRGLSNQQIAGIRDTSLRTVEAQTYSIYQKSGTRGKLDFIAYFILPLLPEEDE